MPNKFIVRKRLLLDFLAEEWKECYIDFRAIGADELRQLDKLRPTVEEDKGLAGAFFDGMVKSLKDHFIAGKGVTESGVADLVADDISALPVEVISKGFGLLTGGVDPNSETPSTN